MPNERVRQLNRFTHASSGPVVYWMSRDQRAQDNWALLYAQKEALQRGVPLVVAFCFVPAFLEGTVRQYGFMIKGLRRVARRLKNKNVPFFFLAGNPDVEIPRFLNGVRASVLVTDFSPLRTVRKWKRQVSRKVFVPFFEVDAHNIVPGWRVPPDGETDPEAFRVKIRSMLPQFLKKIPSLRKHPFDFGGSVPQVRWDGLLEALSLDWSVPEVKWIEPGEDAAQRALRIFLRRKTGQPLAGQPTDPDDEVLQQKLSLYLHFGQLSVQRVVWAVMGADMDPVFKADFLERLILWRELADHFCFHNASYDSVKGFPSWARRTLQKHRRDPRGYLYPLGRLERAQTHDALWNAAQKELVLRGRITVAIVRRYWAKKLLEWTKDPQAAFRTALYFTDKYGLGGWDPGEYFWLAWSLGGVGDSAMGKERSMTGTVRRIGLAEIRKEVDPDDYIHSVERRIRRSRDKETQGAQSGTGGIGRKSSVR
jgi:deoxyribodipyrimidine photo-lyase